MWCQSGCGEHPVQWCLSGIWMWDSTLLKVWVEELWSGSDRTLTDRWGARRRRGGSKLCWSHNIHSEHHDFSDFLVLFCLTLNHRPRQQHHYFILCSGLVTLLMSNLKSEAASSSHQGVLKRGDGFPWHSFCCRGQTWRLDHQTSL